MSATKRRSLINRARRQSPVRTAKLSATPHLSQHVTSFKIAALAAIKVMKFPDNGHAELGADGQ
jgi:hypothetical protein